MKLTAMLLMAQLVFPAHFAQAEDRPPPRPVQVNVIATEDGCKTMVVPGTGSLRSLQDEIPGTREWPQFGEPGKRWAACLVWIPQQAFLDKYEWCALGYVASENCGVGYGLHGGRHVQLTAADPSESAFCSFVCMPRRQAD